ncbi:MAG: M67 family metallopeptidase, partial [Thiohalorhabdaceae bacterium]
PETEVCGLLAGQGGEIAERLPVTNARHRSDAFDMDPAELIGAMRRLREAGQELVAIYHSHPYSAPYPSATDLDQNQYPEVAHL